MSHIDTPAESSSSPVVKALAGLAALAIAMGIGRFAFTPILPMMLQDAGLTIADGGLLASANYLGYLLGALSAMAIRVRAETAIRAGLVVIGATTLAMGAHLPFAAWLALRLVAGIASAWVLISVSAWCLETFARYRKPALNSVVFAGVGTGIAVAGLLCIALIHARAGSARAWMLSGLLALAVTAGIWQIFAGRRAAATEQQPAAHEKYRWGAESLRLVFCYGVFGFGYIIPATFLPVMAKNALQDSTLFGWSWPVFGIAAALSTLAAAWLSRHAGNRRVWAASHVVMAAGVMLPALWSNIFTVFAATLCVGGTFMVITLAAMQEAKRVAGRGATALIAAMTAAFATGQIAGPLSITFAVGGNGFSAALLVAAVMLAASALALSKRAPAERELASQ